MDRFGKNLFYTLSGCLIGSTITWMITKQMYEKRIKEEVDSVKEAYNQKIKDIADMNTSAKESITLANPDKKDYSEYDTTTKENPEEIVVLNEDAPIENFMSTSLGDYALNSIEPAKPMSEDDEDIECPEIIDVSEFGEKEDYNQISYYYYVNNKILTDDKGEKIDDPELLLGEPALTKLDTDEYITELYLEDAANRNYYEILIDEGDYYSEQEL